MWAGEFFNPESKSCGSKISGYIRTWPYCDLVDMVTSLLRPVSQFVQANAPVRIILPFKIKDRPTLCEERSSILERERKKAIYAQYLQARKLLTTSNFSVLVVLLPSTIATKVFSRFSVSVIVCLKHERPCLAK